MKKIWTIVVFLFLGAGILYFFGILPPGFRLTTIASGPKDETRSMELNARGVTELSEGLDEDAVESLRQAAALKPDDPVILRNLSIALARSAMLDGRDDDDALAMLKDSLEIWSRNPEALDGMTTIHFRNSRYDKALEYAEKLQLVFPDRPDLDAYIMHLKQRAASIKGMVSETGDRFRLLYSGNRKLEYEGEITAILQVHMDALTAALGIFPEDPVDVLILTDDLGDRADPLNPFMEGLYDGQIRLYMGDGIEDMDRFIRTVRHEMVHALLHEAAGILPGWVQEGLAQKVGEDPSPESIDLAREYIAQAVSGGYVINLDALDMTFVDMETQERYKAYATSLLFMDWLVRNYGENFIPRFISEISSGIPSRKAAENLTGSDFSRIQQQFARDLRKGG